MTATILVTGGLGFIGSYVVQALLQAGHRIVVIDRLQAGNAADVILGPDERQAATVLSAEIPDVAALCAMLRTHRVERIVHLASPLSAVTESQPLLTVDEMVVPQTAILEAARQCGVRRVVWASSVGVFGRSTDYPTLPIGNDAPHHPLTLYGAAKSFLERLTTRFSEAYGLDTIGLRFPLVYGPGRQRGGGQFTTRLIEGAAEGEQIVVEAASDRYDWMYATDAARSVQLALFSDPTPSRVLTVGGEAATIGDVADLLCGWFPTAVRRDQPGTSDLVADYDPGPALAQIGYAPLTSLRAGVLATLNAARTRSDLPVLT
jgi:nucleoside-diphosphate-sugar epimerase